MKTSIPRTTTYHNEDNDHKHSPHQRPRPGRNPSPDTPFPQPPHKSSPHSTKQNNKQQLHPNTPRIHPLSSDTDIGVLTVGKHRPARRLHEKGKHIGGHKDLSQPAGGHAEDPLAGEEEVYQAGDDHVDECVDPYFLVVDRSLVSERRLDAVGGGGKGGWGMMGRKDIQSGASRKSKVDEIT